MAIGGTDTLLSGYRLGSLQLRNRVVLPAHTTNFGQANHPTARYAAYLAARARGGVGMVITEAVRVHPTSAGRHVSLGGFDDAAVPAFAAVAQAVQAEGAAIFAQVMHAGRQAAGDATRTAPWSASAIPWSVGAPTPHAMGRSDIRTIVDSFASCARRMADAGFDGLELHAGHGHLLQQFLSPVSNQRTDEYGGTPRGRLRLAREVLAAVAGAAGRLPVGLRVSADEFLDGGLGPDQVIEIVQQLRSDFPLSYLHVSHSAYHGSYSLSTQMADMSFPHAPFRRYAGQFKQAFPDLPVIAVCRLDSLREAAELVDAGEADLVALARPHIADPDLVRKTLDGREHEIRSCLACNQACVGRLEQNLPIACVVNPEVGAEREWAQAWASTAASRRRRVLVVGGGPAGLQAALSACRAGDQVTLVERERVLGGQVRRAAAVPGRARLGLLVEDLERDLLASDVTVRLGVELTAAAVDAETWDDVVVATGSVPVPRVSGDGVPVLTSWQAVDLLGRPGELAEGAVVLLDEEGTWTAASLAEALAVAGRQVHLVSPTATLAARITTYSRLALVPRLRAAGVRVHLMRSPQITGVGQVTLADAMGGAPTVLTAVAAVVDVSRPVAYDPLYRALEGREGGPRVHVVGDANAPRSALEAVYEGRMVGAFLGDQDGASARAVAGTS